MDRVARLSPGERRDLFSETAAVKGTTPAVVEKDFWVTWVLGRIFQAPQLAPLLMFKGGTSLSKVYGLIERFSEDIDLILDWRVLEGEDPLAERSKTKQDSLNKAIDEQAETYIARELLALIAMALDGVCHCGVDGADGHVINVRYPAAFNAGYLRPEVRLEIGPLASWLPNEERTISSYAAEAFPNVFERSSCAVRVIKAERTFWEKATILHHEAHRPEDRPQPPRYSRHYYDLARMARSPAKDAALADLELLANVVEFKQRFYPRGWARYDLAAPGTMRLVPEGHVLAAIEADYRSMATMIFGEQPKIGEVLTAIQGLQDEINGARQQNS
ncbi:MAG: nucleotidyl transferase AbiEii/AbiGii toxin family protein [Gammaproteobacteria bacterium]|nr:nucleotidyl transferase AbiEii/AbiGii toxin family protein [Gammaproteobacteria bacterium]